MFSEVARKRHHARCHHKAPAEGTPRHSCEPARPPQLPLLPHSTGRTPTPKAAASRRIRRSFLSESLGRAPNGLLTTRRPACTSKPRLPMPVNKETRPLLAHRVVPSILPTHTAARPPGERERSPHAEMNPVSRPWPVAQCDFFEPGEARHFFLTSFTVAHNVRNSFYVLRWYPTPTTVFTLPILLQVECCFYRIDHDLGLGVNCFACPAFRTGTAAKTPGCRGCQSCNRDDD